MTKKTVVHIGMLKQALHHGLILKKVTVIQLIKKHGQKNISTWILN